MMYAALVSTNFNRSDAEDLLATSFARTYEVWARRDSGIENFERYLRRTIYNEGASRRRAWASSRRKVDRAQSEQDLREAASRADSADDPYDELREALRGLSLQQRTALYYRYWEDREYAEIASIMGCTADTVGVHLSRGRSALRRKLEGHRAEQT